MGSLTAIGPETIIASAQAGKGYVLQLLIPADLAKVKSYKGTAKFLNIKMTAWAAEAKPIDVIYAGMEAPLSIPILFGASAGTDDAPMGADAKRTSVCLSLSQCGTLGQALEVLERDFLAQVQANITKLWTNARKQPLFPCHIKRVYGEKTKDQTRAGQPRADPLVDVKFCFDKFPDKFRKSLAGKPRSTVYDWSSRAMDETGHEVFTERTDDQGRGISPANASSLLASGDIIRRIALLVDGVTIYGDGISLRVSIYKIWTERGKSDMDYISPVGKSVSMGAASSSSASAAPAAVPVAAAPAAAVAPPAKPNPDDEPEGEYPEDT